MRDMHKYIYIYIYVPGVDPINKCMSGKLEEYVAVLKLELYTG